MNHLICYVLFAVILFLHFAIVDSRCLNWCNQRGICTSPLEGGYCHCNMGYTGEDCSQYLCPKAFDPINLQDRPSRKAIKLITGHHGGVLNGRFEFSFGPSSVKVWANANELTSEECTNSLRKLRGISKISCERLEYNSTTATGEYLITIQKYPLTPYENNLFQHDGNPDISLFKCNSTELDIEDAVDPYCLVANVDTSEELPVYAECSNHGSCNRSNGSCDCHKGFKGPACDDILDFNDIVKYEHDGPFFTGSIIKLHAARLQSSEFNILQTQINYQNVTTLRGDGLMSHHGDMHVSGRVQFGNHQLGDTDAMVTVSIDSDDKTCENDLSCNDDMVLVARHVNRNESVFSLSKLGNIRISGSLSSANDKFHVDNEGQSKISELRVTHNVFVNDSMFVQGQLHLDDTIMLSSKGVNFDFSRKPRITSTIAASPALSIYAESINSFSSLFDLQYSSNKSDSVSAIRTITNGVTTFDLSTNGSVMMNSLHLSSGGIEVGSGGLTVNYGGVVIKGKKGLVIESGQISLLNSSITAKKLEVSSDSQSDSLLQLTSTTPFYLGNMIHLSSPMSNESTLPYDFNFIKFDNGDDSNSLFSINSNGDIVSSGSIELVGDSSIFIHHGLSKLGGGLAFNKYTVAATDSIILPSNVSYVVVDKSPDVSANIISFDNLVSQFSKELVIGRLIIITNLDDNDVVHSDFTIPSNTTVLIVYDGEKYIDIQSLTSPIRELTKIRKLEVVNDIDIGNHTISANEFRSKRLTKGRIPIVGSNGLIFDSDKLTFQKGLLQTPSLKTNKLIGDINAQGSTISNIIISQSKLADVSISATEIQLSHHISEVNSILMLNEQQIIQPNHDIIINQESVDFHKNINMNNHIIANATFVDFNLEKLDEIHVNHLFIDKDTPLNGFLTIDAYHEITDVDKSIISFDTQEKSINVQKLSGFELLGDIDGNYHSIKHANLENCSIKDANSISISNNLVVKSLSASKTNPFTNLLSSNENGEIISTSNMQSTLRIDELNVKSLSLTGDLNGNGHHLRNVVIDSESLKFDQIDSLKIKNLYATSVQPNSFLFSSSDHEIISVDGVTYDDISKELVVDSLKLNRLNPRRGNDDSLPSSTFEYLAITSDNELYAIKPPDQLSGITINDQKFELSHDQSLIIPFLASTSLSLIGIDSNGKLVTIDDQHSPNSFAFQHATIDKLSVNELSLTPDAIDSLLSSVPMIYDINSKRVIPSDSITLKRLVSDEMSITATLSVNNLHLPITRNIETASHVLTRNEHGELYSSSNLSLKNVDCDSLNSKSLNLNSLNYAQTSYYPLVVNTSGDVEIGQNIVFENLIVHDSVVVERDMEVVGNIILFNLESPNGILSLNNSKVSIAKDVSVDSIKTKIMNSEHIVVNELNFISNPINAGGSVLIQSVDSGSVSSSSQLYLDEFNKLHAPSLFIDSQTPSKIHHLSVQTAHIESGTISDVSLKSVTSISVAEGGIAQFGDTQIDGSLTVHGTVIGSGPYLESSDRKLKINIESLVDESILEKVLNLNGVIYDHNIKEYPDRNLAPTKQVGWIADEIEQLFPSLVSLDQDGMQAVSYSRSVVYLAKAMQEMQLMYEKRISQLESKILELQRKNE